MICSQATSSASCNGAVPSIAADPDRLRALRRYDVLGSEPDPAFDHIAELAAHLFEVPIGVVNFIDEDRQWFMSATGTDLRETGLEASFCVHTIDEGTPMIVEDLASDSRFADNPYVREGGIRFYAGAPLVTPDNHRLGTVCALDTEPQSPSDELVEQLQNLARMVVDELELRRENARRKRAEEALRRSRREFEALFEEAQDAIVVHDETGVIRRANRRAQALFGAGDEELVGKPVRTLLSNREEHVLQNAHSALREGRTYEVATEFCRRDGRTFWGVLRANVVRLDGHTLIRSTIRDVTRQRWTERLQSIQTRLFERIARGGSRDEVLSRIAVFIEREIDDAVVTIQALEEGALHPVVSPSLPDAFEEECNEPIIGPVQDGSESAADEGQPVEISDLRTDPRWKGQRDLAERADVRSCWVKPLRSEGEVLGRFAVYGRAPRRFSDDEKQLLRALSSVAGVAIQKGRRRATLRRHRRLLDHAQQLTSVGGWEYDVEAGTLKWTEETYRIHGMDPGREVDVEEAIDFYDSEFIPVLRSNLKRVLQEGGGYDLELPLTTVDGERRWVRTIGVAHREEGTTTRLTGAIQDVTQRHEVQQELQEQKNVLRTIFDNAPVLIALFDEEGKLQLVNRQFEQGVGWTQSDVDGRPMAETLFPEPEVREKVLAEIQEPTGTWREFQVQAKGGDRLPVRFLIEPLPDGRRVGIGFDVRERRRREERLKWAQRLAQLGYWARDLETGELFWSEETRRIFGWPEEREVTYEAFMEVVHPDDREALRAAQEAMTKEGEDIDLEYRIRRPSGEERIVRERGELRRDPHGRPSAVMGAVLDVTERARRRRALKEAKEHAEEADRIKSALISNMNHEFRTPLTSIISFSKLIRDNPELADDFAQRILGGGQRLLRTLNTVMDFAEVEGGQLNPTPQTVDLGPVVESVMRGFEVKAERKDLQLHVECPDGSVTARVDPHYLERICTHLVSNAVKFTEEGSVRAIIEMQEGVPQITIQDTGIGISEEFRPRVFDEFAQASSGNDRTHDGNGIGLTVVDRLVERIGGTIRIESEEGEGTRARVRLPAGAR